MKKLVVLLMVLGLVLGGSISMAATVTVTQLLPSSTPPVAGSWYQSDVRTGGTASIVDFAGGPLPTGAAKLTTDMTNIAKAEVSTFGDFGLASTALNNIVLGYDYYKENVIGGNSFAAPSLKLQISAAGGSGDNYGSLVYEPTWNIGAGSVAVPTDVWTSVSIFSSTGANAEGYGGWWWDGGFNIANGAGGPPIRSLSEWVAAFQVSDAVDFANAHIVGLSMGVGTYNQGQIGYFDNVSIKTGDVEVVYDFQTAAVPEPATMLLFGLGLLGLAGVRGKLKK